MLSCTCLTPKVFLATQHDYDDDDDDGDDGDGDSNRWRRSDA